MLDESKWATLSNTKFTNGDPHVQNTDETTAIRMKTLAIVGMAWCVIVSYFILSMVSNNTRLIKLFSVKTESIEYSHRMHFEVVHRANDISSGNYEQTTVEFVLKPIETDVYMSIDSCGRLMSTSQYLNIPTKKRYRIHHQ